MGGLAVGRWWAELSTRVDFPVADAAAEGIDAAALGVLADRMMGRQRSEAFLVARHGRIVLERYRPGRPWQAPDRTRRRPIASMGKALVGGTILAVGVCEGWLDPDAPASRHIPAWREDARKRAVTLRDLATHTSGLADVPPRGSDGQAREPAWGAGYWGTGKRRGEGRAGLAIRAAPFVAGRGVEVRYSNPGYTVYSVAVAKAAEAAGLGPDVEAILEDRVLGPLGIPPRAALLSFGRAFPAEGTSYRELGSGARFTPRAVARVGEMVAAGGSWRGRRIVGERCLAEALRPDLAARPAGAVMADLPAPAPAAGWWSNAGGAWPELPRDLLVAAGAQHRVVVVVPSLGLVAVRLGRRFGEDNFGGDFWRLLGAELLGPLLRAVRPGPRLEG